MTSKMAKSLHKYFILSSKPHLEKVNGPLEDCSVKRAKRMERLLQSPPENEGKGLWVEMASGGGV